MIREIAQKYENVQKGVGDIMGGALIETEARVILNRGRKEGRLEGRQEGRKEIQEETARRMLKTGKLTIEEIAEYLGLSIADVERLAD